MYDSRYYWLPSRLFHTWFYMLQVLKYEKVLKWSINVHWCTLIETIFENVLKFTQILVEKLQAKTWKNQPFVLNAN